MLHESAHAGKDSEVQSLQERRGDHIVPALTLNIRCILQRAVRMGMDLAWLVGHPQQFPQKPLQPSPRRNHRREQGNKVKSHLFLPTTSQ
jgi:hypothetical protein